MRKNRKQIYTDRNIAIVVIIAALLTGLFFYLNIKNQDINFSRRVFAGLIKGRHSVQKLIDWENLQAVGVDVGQTYSALPNGKERADYQRAFVERFSLGFRQVGGDFKSFTNWRLYDNAPEVAIVAADYKDNKTILFTLSKYERKKLTAIQWEDADEQR